MRSSGRPSATASDGELLRRLEARECDALDALYARYSAYVMGVALRILGAREEAEEVVQDVFWQLWRATLRYDPVRGRFSTWLFSVARNRSIDRLRSRPRAAGRADAAQLEGILAAADQEADAVLIERQKEVRAQLELLPGDQRRAIELAFFAGLSHAEIATRSGEALGTVKSRIRRGLLRLRERLELAEREPRT